MNRYLLQILVFLAFIPFVILIGGIFIVILPIIFSGMTYNAYNFNRNSEFVVYLILTLLSMFIALSMLGIV